MKRVFTLGASEMATEFVVPRLLPELIKRLSHLDLKIDVRDSLRIFEKVLRGDLELGIIGLKSASEYVDFKTIVRGDRLILIAPPGHPLTKKENVTINDLRGQDFVGFPLGTGTRAAYERVFNDAGLTLEEDLNVVVEIGDTRGVIQAVEIGTGISVVSELAAQNRLQLGKLAVINVPMLCITRNFYLITLKGKKLTEEAQQVVSVIDEVLKPGPKP